MITLKQFMELVNYRITEGSDYGWNCYGPDAYQLDSWDGEFKGSSFTIIFDTNNQTVYEVQAHDYKNQRAYRIINPDFIKKMKKEAKKRDVFQNQAWDDINYTELETETDWIAKSTAIFAGLPYDTNIEVPLDLEDDKLFELMKMAHKQNITLNQLVENMLKEYIARSEISNDAS